MQEEQKQSVLYQEIRNAAIVLLPGGYLGIFLFITWFGREGDSLDAALTVPIVFAFNMLWFVSTKIWPIKNKRTWMILTAIILTLSIYVLVCSYYFYYIIHVPMIHISRLRAEECGHLWCIIIAILLFNILWLKAMKLWPSVLVSRKIRIFLIILFFALSIWHMLGLVLAYILSNAMH